MQLLQFRFWEKISYYNANEEELEEKENAVQKVRKNLRKSQHCPNC